MQDISRDQAAFLGRYVRAGRLEPPDDLEPRLLAAAARAARRDSRFLAVLRGLLVAAAVLGIAVAAPALALGQDDGVGTHAAHEVGSVQVALYLGLIAAAVWPRRARGVLAVLASAAALLVVTAADDVAAGRTTAWHETPHAIAVVGSVLVWLVARRTPEPAARPYRPTTAVACGVSEAAVDGWKQTG